MEVDLLSVGIKGSFKGNKNSTFFFFFFLSNYTPMKTKLILNIIFHADIFT